MHDATLNTPHDIERLMYRGRYSAEAVSYTAPQPHPRALPLSRQTGMNLPSSSTCMYLYELWWGRSLEAMSAPVCPMDH